MKKAISPLIAWILLVGFTIATAAFITNFIIGETERTVDTLSYIEEGGFCEGVYLDLMESCKQPPSLSCTAPKIPKKLELNLVNKGSFTIKRLAVNVLDFDYGGGQNKIPNSPNSALKDNKGLKPGEELIQTLSFCLNPSENEVKIIPSINATQDKKEKFCNENALVLRDDILDSMPDCT